MADEHIILVLSDIHYASAAEQARGHPENSAIHNPFLKLLAKGFRHFIWRRDPFNQNHWVTAFLNQAPRETSVIALGDFSCDTKFVGISDDVTCQSVEECINLFRKQFGARFQAVLGDHELGKTSLFGGAGGPRLASWYRAQSELGIQPFWQLELGQYRLVGVTSSLLALPVYESETLPEERAEWRELRRQHLAAINQAFRSLTGENKVILFCHDPTALPFLWREEAVRERLTRVECTFIGHLHSPLLMWKSRLLAGMPTIRFLGNSVYRMSAALHEARCWVPFKVRLCPALAGIELHANRGYYEVRLDVTARQPARFHWRALAREALVARNSQRSMNLPSDQRG